MRKYDVLKFISESRGVSPKEIAVKLDTSLPNIYIYLQELQDEGLIKKYIKKYIGVKTSKKYRSILNMRAIMPKTFHHLLTPRFKQILIKLCEKISVKKTEFSHTESNFLENYAVPKRIVLVLKENQKYISLK